MSSWRQCNASPLVLWAAYLLIALEKFCAECRMRNGKFSKFRRLMSRVGKIKPVKWNYKLDCARIVSCRALISGSGNESLGDARQGLQSMRYSMKITRWQTTLSAGSAVLLLLCAYAGQGEAASRTVVPYNPKDDPNYTQATAKTPPGTREAISILGQAFETTPYAGRRQDVTLSAPPQPLPYTQATAPQVPASSAFDVPIYGAFGAVPYYVYSPPFPWRQTSPRIPWWSLLPLTKHKRH
jgi:hypothetical protein